MNIEETEKQKQIREISEKNNPYANECPNWHLWSEGFRSGYKYRIEEQEAITDEEIEKRFPTIDIEPTLRIMNILQGEGAKLIRDHPEQFKLKTK